MPKTKTKTPAKKAAARTRQIIGKLSGVRITLDDSRDKTLILGTPGGHKITLSDRPFAIEIVDGSGNAVRLEPGGITIMASARVTVMATEVKVKAGTLNVEAALSKFTGTVQCDTVITNSVVSASYTPGAGNIW